MAPDLPDPLNGLRGIAALHVMFSHVWFLGRLAGILEMPLFYLLSGYCLTLAYCPTMDNKTFDTRTFLINRFCRLAPMYWLVNFGLWPLVNFIMDLEEDSPSALEDKLRFLLTLTSTNTWVYPWRIITPYSFTSWTVNTLFFFYLTFPALLRNLRPLSNNTISRLLVIVHLAQSIPVFIFWLYVGDTDANYQIFRKIITENPVLRLPVFVMGILGGIQTLRWRKGIDYQDQNENKNLFHDLLPWTVWEKNKTQLPWRIQDNIMIIFNKENSKTVWRRKTDRSAIIYILLFIITFCYDIKSLGRWLDGYCQLFLVHIQLIIIIGLSRSENSSILARICSLSVFQFFGNISMVLYLIHLDLMQYFILFPEYTFSMALYGSSKEASKFDSTLDVLLMTGSATLLAVILQYSLVKPAAKLIKYILMK